MYDIRMCYWAYVFHCKYSPDQRKGWRKKRRSPGSKSSCRKNNPCSQEEDDVRTEGANSGPRAFSRSTWTIIQGVGRLRMPSSVSPCLLVFRLLLTVQGRCSKQLQIKETLISCDEDKEGNVVDWQVSRKNTLWTLLLQSSARERSKWQHLSPSIRLHFSS